MNAQTFVSNNADFAVGGTAALSTGIQSAPTSLPQMNSQPAGLLVGFQVHPYTWAGFEVGYRLSNVLMAGSGSPTAQTVAYRQHEGTGAYLVHSRSRGLQPFVGIGGGVLYFEGKGLTGGQLTKAGLLEAGLDFPSINPHFGLRVLGRSLYYRDPDLAGSGTTGKQWQAEVEPGATLYYRF